MDREIGRGRQSERKREGENERVNAIGRGISRNRARRSQRERSE